MFAGLGLYDVFIFCDDSGSMKSVEGGSRIEDLKIADNIKEILTRITSLTAELLPNGYTISFINTPLVTHNVRATVHVLDIVSKIEFLYQTPLGTMIKQKLVEPFVLRKIREGRLERPTLFFVMTDGEPYPEPRDVMGGVIGETMGGHIVPY
ncbi:hypothetical protein HDU97_006608 [Phlyctochytrium planicorne]|nr:hypothetical protein HDU97_006608 [Phlyctochytrium planicorne]